MPRANRYIQPDCIYHITHRCHDRAFLFKFAWTRNAYQALLRKELRRFNVSLLNYCVTSNHVHLLVVAKSKKQLSLFMQILQGVSGQQYNRRKHRNGAFWSDRYHATMIDSGEYLWRCMKYIDLNMVRAQAVAHPVEWKWTGYAELIGEKKRNGLIDRKQLLLRTEHADIKAFREHYQADIEAALFTGSKNVREPDWTEALAVGSVSFVNRIERQLTRRIHLEKSQKDAEARLWVLKEPEVLYGGFGPPNKRHNPI